MEHKLPDLPWSNDALSPYISTETIEYHYGKHHAGYVSNLNQAIQETEFKNMSLVEIIKKSSGSIFNNAAQTWNHSFYWNCLSPVSGGDPSGALGEAILKKWKTFDMFKSDFSEHAVKNFGSGWTWLVKDNVNELKIIDTQNAGCPITDGRSPLLTIDIWEHAYYIDYRNARAKYIDNFWEIVNWDFANKNFSN